MGAAAVGAQCCAPEPTNPNEQETCSDALFPNAEVFRHASGSLSRLNDVVALAAEEDARSFFAEALKSGQGSSDGPTWSVCLTVQHLADMAKKLKCSDYSEEVLQRVFDKIERDPQGQVCLSQFMQALARGPASATLRNLILKFRTGCSFGFSIPDGYDYSRSTNENYQISTTTFVGQFKELRQERDYTYHVNYTEARQAWQDAAINSIIGRTVKQAAPWLVYTCGPMGVGKGYALEWMSKQGIFPLEHIVHVDPDGFKLMMPEWPQYVARDAVQAGTLCHMESSFMMEIAQEAAVQLRQNIWIDGSLRNADFYATQFEDIRSRYPHYKIAIFYVNAPEATIRERIRRRAEATGRDVPENLIVASLGAMDHSLNTLTPLSNFVARINNEGPTPVLKAFETVDAAGSWEVVRERFARTCADVGEFPNALAPLACARMPIDAGVQLCRIDGSDNRVKLVLEKSATSELQAKVQSLLPKSVELVTSPAAKVTLPEHDRKLAAIHPDAVAFFWIYPIWQTFSLSILRRKGYSQEDLEDPLVHLLLRGAFAYLDISGKPVQVNVVTSGDGQGYIQFGMPSQLSSSTVSALPADRFQPTPRRYREASSFAWILPGEVINNVNVGGGHGAFGFQVNSGDATSTVLFPVIC